MIRPPNENLLRLKPLLRAAPVLATVLVCAGCTASQAATPEPAPSGAAHGQASFSTRTPAGPTTTAATPAPTSAAADQVVVIGDSLSTGYGTSPDTAWPALLANTFKTGSHPLDMVNASVNGSGYVSAGDGGATFLSEVTGAVSRQTKVVLIFGSENDIGADNNQLTKATADTFAAVRANAPEAAIVVVGPPSYTDNPEPARLQVRDQDRAAAQAAGVLYIDPIEEHWIMGNAQALIGPDGDHPSAEGQRYLGDKMEAILRSVLPS
ncbi:SGNH/GDSL hydrolase family protein [Paenarthrobacter sp. Z7-10]|uniref:SGNH/GDSL hydrolase family protein n=1 Tax=Paenarthrobacter sp. Z7-10 TaxID=2787635 RepID=UPI0022A975BB|nr:SGNH/GDSL hydrolase family protein [Paenarthrobacter sp. Z7-10]MCZ2403123.1 SGNH/GDSL hydrolase family protein [Paenarthrobacter sp. Z7-10]